MIQRIATGLIAGILALPAFALEIGDYQIVDLSHAYNSDTLYWPTSPSKFEKTELDFGETADGYFYSAFSISTPEHGGTHLDAPLHFAADGYPTDRIPLRDLIGNAVVIDISKQAAVDRNYRLSVNDVHAFEDQHGRIGPGVIVLLRTDWDQFWPDAKAYLGDDTPGDDSKLQFPAYGADAARLLVDERRIHVVDNDADNHAEKHSDQDLHRQ